MSEPFHTISVTTASRLHFGMFSFGQTGVRQFGGVGAMIAPPSLRVVIRPADRFRLDGPDEQRVRAAAEPVFRSLGMAIAPPCEIRVETGLIQHAGLGSGTQLALAIAAGLFTFLGHPVPTAMELARIAGRGRRSAIGTHGFDLGGLIMEGGMLVATEISPLVARVALPMDWRFVLIRPGTEEGLSGISEHQAFHQLPPVPIGVSDQMRCIARDELIPAADIGRFAEFARALGRYSELAGNCFASIQGGPFNGPRLTELANDLAELGAPAVGQSSWGPTLFVPQPSEGAAEAFVSRIRTREWSRSTTMTIAAPANHGAIIRCETSTPHSVG